jgi:uncharacterized protein (DUF885 family)
MLRDARAFLDPELQSAQISAAQAFDLLTRDVVLSHAFATEEIERFTLENPGQAVSYFYGLHTATVAAEGNLGGARDEIQSAKIS